MTKKAGLIGILILVAGAAAAEDRWPAAAEHDFTIPNFRFESGEMLPALKLHYRTLGTPQRDARGGALNAVLILHGTTGSGRQFLNEQFAGVLFGPGQLLDAT